MLLSKELIFSAFLVLINTPSMAQNTHGKKQMQWDYSPPLCWSLKELNYNQVWFQLVSLPLTWSLLTQLQT